MGEMFLFPDCNILLHYTFFTDIDWPKLANADAIELVFPSSVINTLDRKKFDSADLAVKDRARKVILRLDEISDQESPQIRPNVTLHELVQGTEINYARWALTPDSEDDRMIAEILEYRATYPDRNIAMVTADRGVKVRCKQHHIAVLQLSDDYRLPDRPDGNAKQLRELEARLSKLESTKPDLKLAFPSGRNFTSKKLKPPRFLSEAEIEQRLKKQQESVAKKDLTQEFISRMYNTAIIEQAAAREHLDQYRSYLEEVNGYALKMATVIELEFVLNNDGHASAEDTDVTIFVDGKFLVISEAHLPKRPKKPLTPTERKREEIRTSLTRSIHVPNPPTVSNISGPIIQRIDKNQSIQFNVKRLKQANQAVLRNVYIDFRSATEAESFNMNYLINSLSLPTEITGDLHVKVEREL